MASDHSPGRLNVFQRAMLQWNDLHPYHAVHVLRFRGVPNLEQLREAIANRLAIRGLSDLSLDRQAGTFRYGDAPSPVEVSMVTAGRDPLESLHAKIEQQLNLRFEIDGRFAPFRFFVLREDDSFLLGATYFHPIADAESVAILLRELVTDYVTGQPSTTPPRWVRHPPRHDRLRSLGSKVIGRKLLELPSAIRTMRHSYRPPLRDAADLSNRFRLMRVPPEALNGLTRTARAWGITLHDLLLAVLLKALAPLAPERFRETRRNNISLGTIVNLRRDYGIDCERTFGLFLGSFVVTHSLPEGIALKQLAADLHRQTSNIKRGKLYLATSLELRLATRVITLYSTPRRRTFYHKHHPLWGSITNMNMNKLWPEDAASRPMDYFRAVSTGPATPLVLSVTTLGEHMTIGLTYRPALFTAEQIARVQGELTRQSNRLEECN